jgi:hypothetical protein
MSVAAEEKISTIGCIGDAHEVNRVELRPAAAFFAAKNSLALRLRHGSILWNTLDPWNGADLVEIET